MKPQTELLLIKFLAFMFIISLFLFFVYGIYKIIMQGLNLLLAKKTNLVDLEARLIKLEENITILQKTNSESYNSNREQIISNYNKNTINRLLGYVENLKNSDDLKLKETQLIVLEGYKKNIQSLDKMINENLLLNEKMKDKEKQIRVLLDLLELEKKEKK